MNDLVAADSLQMLNAAVTVLSICIVSFLICSLQIDLGNAGQLMDLVAGDSLQMLNALSKLCVFSGACRLRWTTQAS
jgi:hypothetical protein